MTSNFLAVLFIVGLVFVIWITLRKRSNRKQKYAELSARYREHGPFTIAYECLEQLFAWNPESNWFIMVYGRNDQSDLESSRRNPYSGGLGFHRSACIRIRSRQPTGKYDERTAALDLSFYELTIDGPNDASLSPIVVSLSGHRADIDPWIKKVFSFECEKSLQILELRQG